MVFLDCCRWLRERGPEPRGWQQAEAAEALARVAENTGTPVLLCKSSAAAAKAIKAGGTPPGTEVSAAVADYVNAGFPGLPDDIASVIRPPEPEEE